MPICLCVQEMSCIKTDTYPLVGHVVEAVRVIDSEAHDNHAGLGVGQGPQPVIVLLAGRVPQGQLHTAPVNLCVCVCVCEGVRRGLGFTLRG